MFQQPTQEFIAQFQDWRANNNYPKRTETRDLFREYREKLKKCEPVTHIPVFDAILSSGQPSRFLDSLFNLKGEVYQSDKIRERKEREYQAQLVKPVKETRNFEYEVKMAVLTYIKDNNYMPTFSIINNIVGFKANKYFKSEKEILDSLKQDFDLSKYMLTENDLDEDYIANTNKAIKNHKRYFVTTAVSSKKINSQLFNSIKTYCEHNNAICLVLPCEDRMNRQSVYKWQFPTELNDPLFYVVYNDTYLNSNLYISDIKVSAKQINPQSGLPQFTQDGSVIIASPKQDLDYVANSNNKLPNAIMTTGAITENDYSNDAFMSQRLNKIAEYEHVLGGIIVEVEDDKIFHFRQVQMGANGEIIDLGICYTPDGDTTDVEGTAMVLGDSHFGEHDEVVIEAETDMIDKMGVKYLALHDVFSGISISHHDQKKTITLAKKANNSQISLEDEAQLVADELDYFAKQVENVVVVNSNHHEHLDRYLEEGRYATDKVNLRYSLDIVKAMIDGEKLPVRYMIENQTTFESKDSTRWLEPDEDFDFYGIEISQHGSRGANGSKGNLGIYRKAYKKSMSAHTHQPKIYRGAVSVGTSSKLKLGYNTGLSSWVQGVGVIYPNGTFQLINVIQDDNGNYSWRLK